MQLTKFALVFLLTAVLAVSAQAGPPLNGVYNSTDIGGDVSTGRYMEGYDTPGGAAAIGTTLNAQSWDGANLGTEWSYSCAVVETDPILVSDTVSASGTGSRTYEKHFEGGTIWLSGSGPWGNGDAEYTGPILSYVETETVTYLNWNRIHAVTNVTALAAIEGYNDTCLGFTIGNGFEVGSTDFGDDVPVDYPAMLDASTCAPTTMYGAWWDMLTLSLYIDGCTVDVEESSWGGLKSLYR